MAKITVIGKDNLGYSPVFGPIVKGQEYTIDDKDFAPELFELPGERTGPLEGESNNREEVENDER